jgi:deoxyribodipyrimidine photo-lyase
MKSIFIFRRDFRLDDNNGFIECYKKSSSILPIFIFTPEQVANNEYFSSNAFQFMLESLNELNNYLQSNFNSQIHYYYGDNVKILKKLLKEYKYDSIFFNKDYTPYAQKRDKEITDFCNSNKIEYTEIEDYLLMPIGTFLKDDGKEYQKYTPFKNKAKTFEIPTPNYPKFDKSKFDKIKYTFKLEDLKKYYQMNPDLIVHGGRENANHILKNMKQFANYATVRNDLNTPTTHLSAYIKFGCVSIREVYNAILKNIGIKSTLIDQLLWREFYYYLSYYNPKILGERKSLKEQYDNIKWENKASNVSAWKDGNTGFPGVDAGMREMNQTGFMHNRARLITSGILIKILNCDWRIGEKYFATQLVDYDPIVNNGNWQWSSGSGADSQPYFRILSPWKQVIDNDPKCEYVKKWIPQLNDINNKDIFKWNLVCDKYKIYRCPIVNYEEARKEIVMVYKEGLYEH